MDDMPSLSALLRVGVTFTGEQKQQVAEYVKRREIQRQRNKRFARLKAIRRRLRHTKRRQANKEEVTQ